MFMHTSESSADLPEMFAYGSAVRRRIADNSVRIRPSVESDLHT